MAESSVVFPSVFQRRIEEQLTCSVCLELYKDPRVLNCQHSFCLQCLQALKRGERNDGIRYINCPSCRKESDLPPEGENGFPAAFYLVNMIDELQAAQQTLPQSNTTTDTASLANHKLPPAGKMVPEGEGKIDRGDSFSSLVMCTTHKEEVCRIYCVDCQALICIQCIVTSHKGHGYKTIQDVFDHAREEVQSKLSIVKEKIEEGMESLEDISKRENEIKLQEITLKNQVSNYAEEIISIIKKSQDEKLQQIEVMTEKKMKALTKQKLLLQENIDQLISVSNNIENIIEKGTQEEFLSKKKSMLSTIQSCVSISDTKMTPCQRDNIKFTRNASLFIKSQQLGYLLFNEDTSYSMECEPPLMAGEMATVSITIPQSQRVANLFRTIPPFTCTVNSVKTGVCIQCNIESSEDLEYIHTVSFIPTASGEHILTIKSEDTKDEQKFLLPIVHPSPEMRNKATPILDSLNKPTGITLGKEKGEVIVVENGTHSLLVLSSNGCVTTNNSSYLNNPWGVALNNDGKVFVTDEHRLSKMNPYMGNVIKSVGNTKKGSKDSQFNNPKGLAVHPLTNSVYVADSGNYRIMVFDTNLNFLSKFGSKGSKLGAFNRPTDVAFDKAGVVYVANQIVGSIDVYNQSGKPLRRIGPRDASESGGTSLTVGCGELKCPMALTIDSFDNIYVTEVDAPVLSMVAFEDSRISIYRTNGTYVRRFGRKGKKDNDLYDPCGITVDNDGKLYVCDTENGRVIVM